MISSSFCFKWHEDCPRCGIFTDVNDEKLNIDISKINDPKNIQAPIPGLCLKNPEGVLEDSINNFHFIRSIKEVKNKNFFLFNFKILYIYFF